MTTQDCSKWRELLAMHAIGRATDDEALALDEHLRGCEHCRQDARDLGIAASALTFLDKGQIEHLVAVGASAEQPIDIALARRRRRRMAGVLTAAAGVAAAAVVAIVLSSAPAPPAKTVALTGQQGVTASISLAGQTWGTRATLRETGQAPGQVLTVSMKTASGRWWVAGSYRTTGRPGATVVQLSCAVPVGQITDVWVRDQAGRTVLNGYVT
jgi:predicted anti-sigma-YlaC factor YlaD